MDDKRVPIETSPIHVEYQTYMRGCDVANQLVGQYRLGLTDGGIDLTFGYYILRIMNMWKMHKEICLEKTWIPYNHLHLCLRLVKELMACGPVGKFVFLPLLHMCHRST